MSHQQQPSEKPSYDFSANYEPPTSVSEEPVNLTSSEPEASFEPEEDFEEDYVEDLEMEPASAEPQPAAAESTPEPVHTAPEPVATYAHSEAFDMEETGFGSGTDTGKLTITTDPKSADEIFASDSATGEPVEMPAGLPGLGNGNAVRFEIFLSPEQLSCLFRALVATQHSMMTLREAASYLRIPANALEQLAAEGKIPALQLEGRWRFPKSGIDEWVMLQSFQEGEVSDAA